MIGKYIGVQINPTRHQQCPTSQGAKTIELDRSPVNTFSI
jgi:hypothetical protein